MWEKLKENGRSAMRVACSSTKGGVVVLISFVLIVLIASRRVDNFSLITNFTSKNGEMHSKKAPQIPINISCPTDASAPTCSNTSYAYKNTTTRNTSPSCPQFFRYIHEDLKPWNSAGITKEMVESTQRFATFRLAVVSGRAYVYKYRGALESRDLFTLWGIVQLLNRYRGRVPDFDLMFNCGDAPVVKAAHYLSSPPPPLFHYCKDNSTLDILFPDWSFWGWPEVNVRTWGALLEEFKTENAKSNWRDREPYAYWKGNPYVADTRQDLMTCNVSDDHEWDARLFVVDWSDERHHGFNNSNLAKECTYRYKIYIEGSAWSVSQKYILACNSPTLRVKPRFIDFFSRGLTPGKHYWPIRTDRKCKSIKFAVEWGNKHMKESEKMGKAGSHFTQRELSMENVYQYMLHLLTEYSKLLRYKPTIPENSTEICLESMACLEHGRRKGFMLESMVKSVYDSEPCELPPPFGSRESVEGEKEKIVRGIERQEDDWRE